jgi:hypothetical protein
VVSIKSAPTRHTLRSTGKVVALVGVTLAPGLFAHQVPGRHGALLTFMYVWNVVGALVLFPALSHFLLGDRQGERVARTRAFARIQPSFHCDLVWLRQLARNQSLMAFEKITIIVV